MSRKSFFLLALATGTLLTGGCGGSETTTSAEPARQVAPTIQPDIQPALAPAPQTTPPPGPGGVVAAAPATLAPANPTGPLENLVAGGNIFFYDDDNNFLPKDSVDFLQRAIQSYMDTRKYKSDDSPDWPPMTDLSLLVQYKVIRALPAPPPGQKFVLNPETRKVTLAAN